jgi:guanidinopropionase
MVEPIKQPTRYADMADPQVRPRYTGVPTFFRAPYTQDLADTDVGLIGVPIDIGVTNRPGARHGPREVRNQSTLLRKINAATGVNPFAQLRVRDLGDAWIEQPYTLDGAHAEIEAFFRAVVAAGATPLAVGGDHSMSLPILRAIGAPRQLVGADPVAAARPLGMVHIDAHCDTGDDYLGSRLHHGAPFRRAAEAGLLDPKRVIQIGIRGTTNDPDQWGFSRASGMRVLPMDELHDRGWRFAFSEARRVVQDGPTYLSFDIDALDPVFAPGTGTPEAGGISMIEAQRLLRGLAGLDIVAADLVEVSPPFDHAGLTAFNAASLLFEILCVLAEARLRRGPRTPA